MIEQGVRKLFIASNKSIRDDKNRVLKWRENGATVIVHEEVDMSKATNVNNLLKEAASLGQLEAIFDLQRSSMDLSTSSPECSKVTEVLDNESRRLCPSNVKFFVFSSPHLNDDCSRDPTVEKICKQRMESGLHGLFMLLTNSIKIERSKSQFMNTFYAGISLFLQQLNTYLTANTSLIDVRFKSTTKHSVDDSESNVIVVEAEKKVINFIIIFYCSISFIIIFLISSVIVLDILQQEFIEKDQQEEEVHRKMFEKYLYSVNYIPF